ncbi:glycoside hydrolase [Treponema sp. R80B11-R83G3]
MKKQKWLFVAIPLLVLALLFTACIGEDNSTKTDPDSPVTTTATSALPVITIHPTSVDYVGASPEIQPLRVAATVSDSGTKTYQWFSNNSYSNANGTILEGKTSETFTPTEAGIYYAVVTNTKGELTPNKSASNPARIRILETAPSAPTVTVTVNSTNQQYVRGFGGMSNAFGINPTGVARYIELKDIDTMFHPDTGLGYNILRIIIWPNPLEDVISGQVEPQMGNQITYLEVVKRVNKYGGYVLASPWTPPAAWKVNASEAGTSPSYLLPQYYADYAQYLKTYASDMKRYGAPIYTLSLQNEPSWPASYAGCEWSSQQQLDFFLNRNVGKFMDNVPGYGGGLPTESVLVMSGEPHQNITWNDAVKNNATANALVDIYSYHIYGSMNGPYLDVQADTSSGRKEVWMTEHNINSGSGLEAQDYSWNYVWLCAEEIDHVIRVNSTNAFVWWYLKRYYSMVGDNAYGTVNGEVQPRGWVMSHWAKYATDTVRIPAVVSGHSDGGNANDQTATGKGSSTVFVKASAYRRKASPTSYWERQVKKQEDSISLVIFNQKTSGGVAADIRVSLPADFGAANYVYGIISDNDRKHAPLLVTLTSDGTAADFNLPANSIVSLKFIK